jgi:enoyl-CoA hydratase/carnithine racemase
MATVNCSTEWGNRHLTLNNPDKLNAIDLAMWQQLAASMQRLAEDDTIRCVVIRGAGDAAFAAGGDLEEFVTARATLDQALHYHGEVARALNAIADCPHPTVALIKGACIGGGLESPASATCALPAKAPASARRSTSLAFRCIPVKWTGSCAWPDRRSSRKSCSKDVS